jgi:putative hydrolase of the HAD superfamily
MILIFDLDDTLYDESTYVMSGLRAVADFGSQTFGWDAGRSFKQLCILLKNNGRGRIFDDWLVSREQFSKKLVKQCLHVYRHHEPFIAITQETRKLLEDLRESYPLYVVTDGHKVVQKTKIDVLNIAPFFKRVFITHRFGIHNAKPSLHCFNLIRSTERVAWDALVYIGDNPAKDFVSLNQVGAKTIRVLTGAHAKVRALPSHDAQLSITNLTSLSPGLLDKLERGGA